MALNEQEQRLDLAAAHRLIAMEGWDDLIFTMLSARVPGESDRLLVTPYGKNVRASQRVVFGQDRSGRKYR
jgi:ribulose-5-phosphate 4-epimerase/fuculose-1-phosphate aldolase